MYRWNAHILEETEHIVILKCIFNTRNEIVYKGENNEENLLECYGPEL